MDRIDKINKQLQREISLIIQQKLSDPRLMFVTIMQAQVSRDLRSARVHYSVLGDASKKKAAQEALLSAKGIIRKYVGDCMRMHCTPEIHFMYDPSSEDSSRIEQTLREISHESQENYSGSQDA